MKKFLLIINLVFWGQILFAQRFSLGTNVIDWAYFGTTNVNFGVAVHKNISLDFEAKYNPWKYKVNGKVVANKVRNFALGLCYWPWFTYSSWFISSKINYLEYGWGGLYSPGLEEGDAVGLSLGFGYSLMLHKNFNIELGLEGWGGYTWAMRYNCVNCGKILSSANRWFIYPKAISLSFSWLF